MTSESGKPLIESQAEVNYGNSFIDWFAEEARRIYGEIIPSPNSDRELFIIRQPIGVAALITPWNFPHAMITRKAGAALAAGMIIIFIVRWNMNKLFKLICLCFVYVGCTVVIKPAEDTPLTALTLVRLANEAGFPKGVVNIITSSRKNAPEIGEFFCKSHDIAGISFTGSTEVGKLLYQNCAGTIKRLALELGGNAPFIVFESADLDVAVKGAIASKFRNCGQTCVASNRFFIQDSICDKFIEKFIEQLKTLKMGDGLKDKDVKLGPLINKMQFNKVSSFVEDAINKGGKIVYGGKNRSDLGELFFEPTIITNLTPNMKIYKEEVFGPIISIIPFKTEEEALKKANDTRRGLAGYFFSQNYQQIFRVAKKLEVGMIGINEGIISTAEAAFGGVKESGLGREGSRHGIDDFVNMKYICLGNLKP